MEFGSPGVGQDFGSKAGPGIIIRRPSFPFPQSLGPVIVKGRPEESFVYVGTTLLLPYLEPYLIRSMVAAKKQVLCPKLLAEIDGFIGQESQHFRQHQRFNKTLDLEKFSGLTELMAELDQDFQRFSKTRSLRFNLAYAEGFEAFTMAVARFVLASNVLQLVHPVVRNFYQWHLVEELEHRTVTFDVYDHIFGGYWYRLLIGLYAQWHLNQFVYRVVFVLLKGSTRIFWQSYGGLGQSLKRCSAYYSSLLIHFIPKVWKTYLPWYSPHRVSIAEFADVMNLTQVLEYPMNQVQDAD